MATVKVGDTLPSGTFSYIHWTPQLEDKVCAGCDHRMVNGFFNRHYSLHAEPVRHSF